MDCHVGPYIKIKLVPISIKTSITGCNNQICNLYSKESNSVFCPECGTKIIKISIEEEDFHGYHSVMDEYDNSEDFTCIDTLRENEEILIENTIERSKKAPKLKNMEESGDYVNISKEDIELEMEWFNHHFKNMLEILRNQLGNDKVTVHYGVVFFSL